MVLPGIPGISNPGIPPEIGDLDIDLFVVEFAVAQLFAKLVPRGGARIRANKRIQDPLLGLQMRLREDFLALAVTHEADGRLHKIAHDLIHVAADIADLGEFGRLHFEERRIGELGETARDLGLADARRADHEDVFGQNFFPHILVELLAAPAVAQRDGDRALGVVLTDDIAVQFRYDFPRGEVCHVVFPMSWRPSTDPET